MAAGSVGLLRHGIEVNSAPALGRAAAKTTRKNTIMVKPKQLGQNTR